MNKELGNIMDLFEKVVDVLIDLIKFKKCCCFIGFLEILFVCINGVFLLLVDNVIVK